MRYEVTMSDGWKVRVNAASADEAKAKAERMNKYGDKAVSVEECGEVEVVQ
jgi:hypothetical protein